MTAPHYTGQEIVERTREAIRCFGQKQMASFLTYLDDDFVWIGDEAPLYMHGREQFVKSIQSELHAEPVLLSGEEYALLAHERRLWVTYGRFTATSGSGSTQQETRVHFTLVWRQKKAAPQILLANATHVGNLPSPRRTPPQSKFFTHSQAARPLQEKLLFRATDGSMHYLFLAEILYLQANDKLCTVVSEHSTFTVRSTLKELAKLPFLQIHRSYLVNPAQVRQIRRYEAELTNGAQLPIAKERYMTLKTQLIH